MLGLNVRKTRRNLLDNDNQSYSPHDFKLQIHRMLLHLTSPSCNLCRSVISVIHSECTDRQCSTRVGNFILWQSHFLVTLHDCQHATIIQNLRISRRLRRNALNCQIYRIRLSQRGVYILWMMSDRVSEVVLQVSRGDLHRIATPHPLKSKDHSHLPAE
jgi:hypothetical protein